MIVVDNNAFGAAYFAEWEERFSAHHVLGDVAPRRIAVCVGDPAFWIALCRFVKARGGSLYPLPPDSPLPAATRRAERAGCEVLYFGATGPEALDNPVTLQPAVDASHTTGVLVQTSSGTTGEPKFIERTWTSIDVEVAQYIAHFDPDHTMTPVVACPTHHSYGLISGVLVALARGVTPVIIKNLNPKFILRKIAEQERPLLYCSPTLIATIAMLAKESVPIHAVMTSGTLMQAAWFEAVRKKVRHLHQQYGCSEAGCVTLGEDIRAVNEVGVPLPHVELTTGAVDAPAEIVLRVSGGPPVATRDLGYVEGGSVHFVSRMDDMINVSGLNVYPSEVEEVVLALPGITDAVVFKAPHGFGRDQVCLAFSSQAPIANEDIRGWCLARLAKHQVPMRIHHLPTIPKLPNGKVSRRARAAQLA